jgi:hypothetical protein
VGTSFGVAHCDLGETVDGRGGVDCTIGVEEPAMAMRCVLAEANVAGNINGWKQITNFSYCKDDRTGRVISWSTSFVLDVVR